MSREKVQIYTPEQRINRYIEEFGVGPISGDILFGRIIRAARENYSLRNSFRRTGPMPRMKLSALSLLESLKQAGFEISSGAYSEIENTNNLPSNPDGLIAALTEVLGLSEAERDLLSISYTISDYPGKVDRSFEAKITTLKHISFNGSNDGRGFIRGYNAFISGEPIEEVNEQPSE